MRFDIVVLDDIILIYFSELSVCFVKTYDLEHRGVRTGQHKHGGHYGRNEILKL